MRQYHDPNGKIDSGVRRELARRAVLLLQNFGVPAVEIGRRCAISHTMIANYGAGESSPSPRILGRILDLLRETWAARVSAIEALTGATADLDDLTAAGANKVLRLMLWPGARELHAYMADAAERDAEAATLEAELTNWQKIHGRPLWRPDSVGAGWGDPAAAMAAHDAAERGGDDGG